MKLSNTNLGKTTESNQGAIIVEAALFLALMISLYFVVSNLNSFLDVKQMVVFNAYQGTANKSPVFSSLESNNPEIDDNLFIAGSNISGESGGNILLNESGWSQFAKVVVGADSRLFTTSGRLLGSQSIQVTKRLYSIQDSWSSRGAERVRDDIQTYLLSSVYSGTVMTNSQVEEIYVDKDFPYEFKEFE